ncbi:MAG: zf-HC2 domain-containing protein [Actinomycetota bacterium]
MGADQDVRLLQDRVLADRARQGSRPAFEELYRRHAAPAWRLAHAIAAGTQAADAAVASAFASTLASSPADLGQAGHRIRVALLSATRRAANEAAPLAPAAAPEGPSGDAARVRAAFDALPERWRSALWLVDVEGWPVLDATRVVGLEPGDNDQGSLVERARLGLREEVLQAGLGAAPAICRRTAGHLSGYASGCLSPRDERRVRGHLDDCPECRQRLAGLDDLVVVLRSTVAAPAASLAAVAAERWSSSLVRRTGPLHLALPGGEPIPVWAQRALAGTAAAVIALGITGATLLSGRGGRAKPDLTHPLSGEGESASAGPVGYLPPISLDGSGFPTLSLGTTSGAASSALPAEIARSAGAPSSSTAPTSPAGDALPRTGGTSTPSTDPTAPEPPSSPPASDSDDPVTVGVDGVAEVTAGGSCIGAEVLGESIGCEPSASGDPASDGPSDSPLGL